MEQCLVFSLTIPAWFSILKSRAINLNTYRWYVILIPFSFLFFYHFPSLNSKLKWFQITYALFTLRKNGTTNKLSTIIHNSDYFLLHNREYLYTTSNNLYIDTYMCAYVRVYLWLSLYFFLYIVSRHKIECLIKAEHK